MIFYLIKEIIMLKYNSNEILDYIIKNRRYLHSIPELGGNLPKTREFVIKKLEELNIEYTKNKKDSGIIAYIKGNDKNNKTVALRADMDALPIKEETDFEYKSCNNNEGFLELKCKIIKINNSLKINVEKKAISQERSRVESPPFDNEIMTND